MEVIELIETGLTGIQNIRFYNYIHMVFGPQIATLNALFLEKICLRRMIEFLCFLHINIIDFVYQLLQAKLTDSSRICNLISDYICFRKTTEYI